jgi:aromatic ring-cleaving dioxygenase
MAPQQLATIASYHAHVYFDANTRADALKIRDWVAARFRVQLGRVHDRPIGPHTSAMYQVAFETGEFDRLVPWLMLNRLDLSVLVHPNTGHERADHVRNALWLGTPLRIAREALSTTPIPREDIPAIAVDTTPDPDLEA